MPALAIRRDLSPSELRRLARFELDRRASMRLLAIANALEGMSRADAARLAGMERQALRDAVLRYNAEGPEGLHDRPALGPPGGAERRPAGGAQGLGLAHPTLQAAWGPRGAAPTRSGTG
jgi:hypothetical protein